MKGLTLLVRTDGTTEITEWTEHKPLVFLDHLKKAVGGCIETVPYFDRLEVNGTEHRCVAFCDEEGKIKEKPFNAYAQHMWRLSGRNGMWAAQSDALVGDIICVFGDEEFMKEL